MVDADIKPMSGEEARRRRSTSVAIALVLAGLVILFYLVTIVRLGENIAKRQGVASGGAEVENVQK